MTTPIYHNIEQQGGRIDILIKGFRMGKKREYGNTMQSVNLYPYRNDVNEKIIIAS